MGHENGYRSSGRHDLYLRSRSTERGQRCNRIRPQLQRNDRRGSIANTYSYRDRNVDSNGYGYRHGHVNSNSNADRDAVANSDRYRDVDTNRDCDSHSNTYSDTESILCR